MLTSAQRRAARKALNARFGDVRFDQTAVQSELGFRKDGATVVDELFSAPFEYVYPSTIGSALFYEGSFESGEIALVDRILQRSARPMVLDIGANIGVHARAWASGHEGAHVYAFEPTDETSDVLLRNVDRANLSERITVIRRGVGAKAGLATFYECADAAYNSLLPPAERPVTSTSEIELTTIDEFVREQGLTTLDFIKIDVEGFEADVVAGAAATLREFRPALLVEVGRGSRGRVSTEPLIATLVDFGYRAYTVVDGFALPYAGYDGAFENHLFVDARLEVDLPRYPGDDVMLALAAHRISLIALLEDEVAALRAKRDGASAAGDAIVRELTAANAMLQAACDERARLLRSQADALEELRREYDSARADAAVQYEAAAARRVVIDELTEANRLLQSACDERARLLEEQSLEMDELRRGLEAVSAASWHVRAERDERLAAANAIAAERRELLERANEALTLERERSAMFETACVERLEVIERLNAALLQAGENAEHPA